VLALPLYDDTQKVSTPVATVGLVAACVLVFFWQTGLPPRAATGAVYSYGMIPAVLFGSVELPARLQAVPGWMTLVTCQFLHGGIAHIAGNMLYLWIFGRGVEAALGTLRFLLLYLGSGVIAALTQAFVDPISQMPMIGASGAIAGVLGAYLVFNPRGNVVVFVWILVFIRLVSLPAVFLLGLWFLLQLTGALSVSASEPGVAFWAHVGGFVAGIFLLLLLRRRGTRLLQPRRSRAFYTSRARDARQRFGRHGDWAGPWG
jgi:membrane associated rhomboid family serine protease